ncbi:biotin/lipoyl-binding protein, partial [Bacillus haikouensis]|uniref:biotin/lipoyl-containing protein n=1 Tax=Bacillus haikouensis TaxID=1510468 RepID=UPI001556AE61
IKSTVATKRKVDPKDESHIGASMPGTVIKVIVDKGEMVEKGDHLMITEAMKMETTVQAPFSGKVKDIYVESGDAISPGDLLIEMLKA